MHTLVRTYAFLKYAEHQFTCAREFLESDRITDAVIQIRCGTVSLFKAVMASAPGFCSGMAPVDSSRFVSALKDLMPLERDAVELGRLFDTLYNFAEGDSISRDEASVLVNEAVKLFDAVSRVFPGRDIFNE